MKKVLNFLLLAMMLVVSSCGDDNKEPQKINLATIPREYSADNVQLLVNGFATKVEDNVRLQMSGVHNPIETENDMHMKLTMWPDVQLDFVVHAISHADYVEFEGDFGTTIGAKLRGVAKGLIKDGAMKLDLTYEVEQKAEFESEYVYNLSPVSITTNRVIPEVEWQGTIYSGSEFKSLALKPVMDRMRECVGGRYMSVKVNRDCSISFGSKDKVDGDLKPFPGKYYGVWTGSDISYVRTDEQGARFLSKLVCGKDEIVDKYVHNRDGDTYYYRIYFWDTNRGGMQVVFESKDDQASMYEQYTMYVRSLQRWIDTFMAEGRTDDAQCLKLFMDKCNGGEIYWLPQGKN